MLHVAAKSLTGETGSRIPPNLSSPSSTLFSTLQFRMSKAILIHIDRYAYKGDLQRGQLGGRGDCVPPPKKNDSFILGEDFQMWYIAS